MNVDYSRPTVCWWCTDIVSNTSGAV